MASDCHARMIDDTPGAVYLESSGSFGRSDENALVRAAKNGETAAFDALWQSHARKLLRTTYRITRNHEDAGDALQGALLSAFVHIRHFDGRSSFLTWLTRIAVNSALMIIRANRSAQNCINGATSGGWIDFDARRKRAPDPEASYTRREQEAILANAIGQLSPAMREALVLQKLEELSTREAAEIMGISISAAKTRAFRARLKLERLLLRKKFAE